MEYWATLHNGVTICCSDFFVAYTNPFSYTKNMVAANGKDPVDECKYKPRGIESTWRDEYLEMAVKRWKL